MATHAHSTNRGAFLQAAASVVALGAPVAVFACPALCEHPDADLLALGAERERLFAEWLPLWAEWSRLDEETHQRLDLFGVEDYRRRCALYALSPARAASDRADVPRERLDEIVRLILELQPHTLAGWVVKFAAIRDEAILPRDHIRGVDHADWPEEALHNAVEQFAAFAKAGA